MIEPRVFRDTRGFFLETYNAERYAAGQVRASFVQDNHSRSTRNTIRGLHMQIAHAQGKLVRAVAGEMLDVAVDVRVGSPRFGQWTGVVLSGENFKQLWIPPGFAHGFAVLSDVVDVEYKCTDAYHPEDEITIRWSDPAIGIDWPIAVPILSTRDSNAPLLQDLMSRLPRFVPEPA